jgi:hypothetical protein
VALCLENGLVGQGNIKETAIQKLKEAIQSLQDIEEDDRDVYSAPLSIKALHEFLTVEEKGPVPEFYELRAVNAWKCTFFEGERAHLHSRAGTLQLLQGRQR